MHELRTDQPAVARAKELAELKRLLCSALHLARNNLHTSIANEL